MIMSLCMEITNSSKFFILVPEVDSISLYGTSYGTFFIRLRSMMMVLLEESSGFSLGSLNRCLIVFMEIFMFSHIVC